MKALLDLAYRNLFNLRYTLRRKSWPLAEAFERPNPPRMIISGYFNEPLGIGRAGHLVADRLAEMGADVRREDLRPFDRGLVTRPLYSFEEARTANTWLLAVNPPEARLAFYTHAPNVWRSLYRIGLWHWESSVAPADWVELAPYFHEIWASSRFTAEALAAAMRLYGRPQEIAKIRIVPLPVKVSARGRKSASPVRVLTLFDPRSDFDRKNPMAVIEVWRKLFPQTSQTARLIVKTHAAAVHHPRFAELNTQIAGRADIEIMARTLEAADAEQLIRDTDILVSLHRGEGFGLPLAEAMAAGVSVIATGWSGNMQFMTPENSIPLPYKLIPASRTYNGPAAQWADPDLDAAVKALRRLIEDGDLRRSLGERARTDIEAIWQTWPQWKNNP